MGGLLILALFSYPLYGAIAYVNAASHDTGGVGGTQVSAPATSHTTGNLLYVTVMMDTYCGGRTVSVSDTASNSYTQIGTVLDSGFTCQAQFYAKNITGNANNVVAATWSLESAHLAISVLQFSGVDSASPLDASATGTATSATLVTSGTFSTATANQVLVAGGASYDYSRTWTADTGYTIPSGASTEYAVSTAQYQIVSSTQNNVTADLTVSSSSAALSIMVATFKEASGGGSPSALRRAVIQ